MTAKDQTTMLQGYIDKMLEGDDSYRQLLVEHAYGRLRWLAKKQMATFDRVRPVAETDDILHQATLKLWRSLEATKPRTVREFFGLAKLQIRRTLLDLCKGKHGPGANHAAKVRRGEEGRVQPERADDTGDPAKLAVWTEFHQKADELPEELREVFALVYYNGVTQPEAAALLGMSERTLKRRWWKARLALSPLAGGDVLGDED
jgi:RNA polymerase sigma-70 factor (ECF subfamily)